jgi:hypothetical protein
VRKVFTEKICKEAEEKRVRRLRVHCSLFKGCGFCREAIKAEANDGDETDEEDEEEEDDDDDEDMEEEGEEKAPKRYANLPHPNEQVRAGLGLPHPNEQVRASLANACEVPYSSSEEDEDSEESEGESID